MAVARLPAAAGPLRRCPRRPWSMVVTLTVAVVAAAPVVTAAAAEAVVAAAAPPSPPSPQSTPTAPGDLPRWTWARLSRSDPASPYTWPLSSLRRPIVNDDSVTAATRRGLYVLHPDSGWWRWTPRGSVCDTALANGGGDGGDWVRLPTVMTDGGVRPPAVSAAAVAVDAAGGRLWVFGGVEPASPSRLTATLYEYDEAAGRWTWLSGTAEATQPGPPRHRHGACVEGPAGVAGAPTGAGGPCAMAFPPARSPTGLAFAHDPAADALYVAGMVASTTPGVSPFGQLDDGRDVRVWRYDLPTRTWSVAVAYASAAAGGGPPPVHWFWGHLTAFAAGGHVHLVRDDGMDRSLWRYSPAGAGAGAAAAATGWTRLVAADAPRVDAVRHATWTAGRYWLAYLPGARESAGPGGVGGLAAAAGVSWLDPGWTLTDADRFVAWDSTRAAVVGAERRRVPAGRLVPAGGQAVPGWRRRPHTGGTLVAGAPGCAATLVGYLLGGDVPTAVPPTPRDDLWRVTFDVAGLDAVFAAGRAANGSAAPSPSPPPSQPRGSRYEPFGGRAHPIAPRCATGFVWVPHTGSCLWRPFPALS